MQQVKIVNIKGLHARASARFVKLAATFDAIITVSKDGADVVGTSIMGLMLLAAACHDTITIKAEGADADAAITALIALVTDKFGEEK